MAGTNITKPIDDATNLATIIPGALGYALPPILPLVQASVSLLPDLMPFVTEIVLRDTKSELVYKFPVDPMLSVSGRNIVAKRTPAKSKYRGSIKERWSQDDYSITITGTLQAVNIKALELAVGKLIAICEAGKQGLAITCDILNAQYNVVNIVIEDYDLPFTAGEQNQDFTIKALSDDVYSLLIAE